MLPFKVHRLNLGGKHYLLLPKLNGKQMEALAGRLERKGFRVLLSSVLSAKSRTGSIHIDPAGFSWSSFDPEDVVVPAIPDLLSCPKEKIPFADLGALYFSAKKQGKNTLTKLLTRVESDVLWDSLRASGECGLTPDERSVALALLSQEGKCRLTTDFVGEEPIPLVLGRKRYFESSIDSREAKSTLRVVGERAPRSSYVPRDNIFSLIDINPSSSLEDAFHQLGDWCSFLPL